MKRIIKRIIKTLKQSFCPHQYTVELYTKEKYKSLSKGGYGLRYDVYSRDICEKCGHIRPGTTDKIRSGLTYDQARVFMRSY